VSVDVPTANFIQGLSYVLIVWNKEAVPLLCWHLDGI